MFDEVHRHAITNAIDLSSKKKKRAGGEAKEPEEKPAVSPLINLETQHDGRSARTWMKRV